MQTGYLFVQLLTQTVYPNLSVRVLADVDLSYGLVSETVGHYETGMTGCHPKLIKRPSASR